MDLVWVTVHRASCTVRAFTGSVLAPVRPRAGRTESYPWGDAFSAKRSVVLRVWCGMHLIGSHSVQSRVGGAIEPGSDKDSFFFSSNPPSAAVLKWFPLRSVWPRSGPGPAPVRPRTDRLREPYLCLCGHREGKVGRGGASWSSVLEGFCAVKIHCAVKFHCPPHPSASFHRRASSSCYAIIARTC